MDINSRLARSLKKSARGRQAAIAGYRFVTVATHRSDHDPAIVITLPKSGTHLFMSLLDALPGYRFSGRHFTLSPLDKDEPALGERLRLLERELLKLRGGLYMTAHLAHHPRVAEAIRDAGLRVIVVVRDPRALVVSGALYMRSYERHPLHSTVKRRFSSDEALFRASVEGFEQDEGTRHLLPMADRLMAFAPWLSEPDALVVRFEDVVGSAAGGSRDRQTRTVQRITSHLGIEGMSQTDLEAAGDAAFDTRSATFRKPDVEGWRVHLTPDLVDLVESECREPAARLGYFF